MLQSLFHKVFGSQNSRQIKRMAKVVEQVNAFESAMQARSSSELKFFKVELKQRLDDGQTLEDLIPEAFAAVREASVRTLKLRHFDVQLMGGLALHEGNIAEMRTGEGKTLVSTLASYLNAISGKGVHLITVNDYLARRDGHWMAPIFEALGMSVGIVQSSGAMGPDDNSFLFDTEFDSKIENFKYLRSCSRQEAYGADITYGTNNEFGFDYLRDNMVLSPQQRTQRELNFAVIDEVDSILIDEARTPLIISGAAEDSSDLYRKMDKLIKHLNRQKDESELVEDEEVVHGDFIVDEKSGYIDLTEDGHTKVEQLLIDEKLLDADSSLYASQNLSLLHHIQVALKAHHVNTKNVEYIIQDRQILLIDQHTGRTMPGRRMGEGLHQALEAKEGVEIQSESQTMASTTYQNYFRLYNKLSGMTGTADTEAEEFHQIYGLQVVVIPTNRPTARNDLNDLIYLSREEKFEAVIESVKEYVEKGAPVLVGTVSVESSEFVSKLLIKSGIKHEVLNAKYHEKEAQIIANAGLPGAVTIATNMAGRGTDIVLGGNLEAEMNALGEISTVEKDALIKAWKKRHQAVLDSGGLHIIGTERHESRRIDNQLRGRAGRQGDPGLSRFYLSMDDSLMRLFASDKVRSMMRSLGMEKNEAIEHRFVTSSIEKAQRKVEQRNFDYRKQVLEYDDVANDQRRVVYQRRNQLMESQNITHEIKDMRAEVISALVASYMQPNTPEQLWELPRLEEKLRLDYGLELELQKWVESDKNVLTDQVTDKVVSQLTEDYDSRTLGLNGSFRRWEVEVFLQILDNQWKEHLATMDHLRAGISLRGYGGRNPKQEYKRESFELFTQMMDRTEADLVKVLSRVRISSEEELEQIHQEREKLAQLQAEKMRLQQEGQSEDGDSSAVQVPLVREPKVGRNDPCPCGSGKKYKQCHGKL